MSQRLRILHAMHQAGLRIDDAAIAADVAMRSLREQRRELAHAARAAGLSYRRIARIVGMSPGWVVAVFTRGASL